MSRLPRLQSHSSDDRIQQQPTFSLSSSSSSTTMNSLKRKAAPEDTADPPRKRLAPIPETKQPLQDSKTGTNLAVPKRSGPPPLTRPLPTQLATAGIRRTQRATSAPPTRPPSASGSRPGSGPSRPTGGPKRPAVGRAASGSGAAGAAAPKPNGPFDFNFLALENRVASVESAREADVARLAADMQAERAKVAELQANHFALSQELTAARSQEINQRRELGIASNELEQIKRRHANQLADMEMDMSRKDRKVRELEEELRNCKEDLERERGTVATLKATVAQQSTSHITFTTQIGALQAQIAALQSTLNVGAGQKTQLEFELEKANKRIEELKEETLQGETLRRKLHNMVQELKGNIRVFCRVRPLLPSDLGTGTLTKSGSSRGSNTPEPIDEEKAKADLVYPDKLDHREIVVSSSSESATGQERKDQWAFSFDRVFEPDSTQSEVFEEVSQLAQSCTDGYNVCVFAYGQTGSGKSFTMEGGSSPATAGMIPRAVEQVFRVAEELKTKGWQYTMEGQMLEIYNETINDLLGKGEFDKKKHEIKHDKSGRTTVTDVNVIPLTSASQVRSLLAIAQSRRTVAATLMNERSSRSHSVFTLRIRGSNSMTGETCEGSLNLVDLAGSERLEKSGAGSDKDRLRETQNINRSLSALGDVIAALGEKGEGKGDKHIPYRNSKLTYLLQNSLSGNSKTLMVLNLSPLQTHLNESLCSLRFATKVNNTTIGTAKKQSKTSSS
ncbi:kinesin-domain-containing protein [Cristinia sonorae]|uniref:Kinesin-like protein n=1 Tax=Cristinia sonorae TaxID=1940300 RepID=A0A8K0UUT6_9AGAR|nr:kinesin-domain-containing protein [Cristinia sonorae]